ADAATASLTVSTTNGGPDVFLAKYDPSSAPLWIEHAGNAATSFGARGDDVTSDGTSIYVSGFAQGPVVFDAQTTLSTSSTMFVAKYDGSGAVLWAQGATTPDSSSGEGLAVSAASPTGGVAVGGSYAGTMTVGSITLTSSGQDDAFA